MKVKVVTQQVMSKDNPVFMYVAVFIGIRNSRQFTRSLQRHMKTHFALRLQVYFTLYTETHLLKLNTC